MDVLEEQSREYSEPDLDVDEDIRLLDDRRKHGKDIVEDNINDKLKVHTLRCYRNHDTPLPYYKHLGSINKIHAGGGT